MTETSSKPNRPHMFRVPAGRFGMPGREGSQPPIADDSVQARRDQILFVFFVVQVLAVTVLQKIGYGGSSDAMIAVVVPVMAIGLGVTALLVRPALTLERVGLFLLFAGSAVASTGLFADRYSMPSLALLIILYLPLVIGFPTTEANYRRCMNFFTSAMIAVTAMVFVEHAIQLSLSAQYWPNLEKVVPSAYLIPNFNYLQPIVFGKAFMKPNAVVFLETSFVSQYIALALAIEVALFQRPWRLAILAGGLFATFAGTGMLLMLIALPVLLGRMRIKNMALVVVALVAVVLIAVKAGWFKLVALRVNEYQHAGSSANHRFIEPIERMFSFADSTSSIYSGIGAGQIEKIGSFQFWPIAKVVIEYGYITGALFYAFYLYAMFDRAPSRRLAFTLVVWFSLEGSLLTPVNPLLCAILSSFFIVQRDRKTRKSDAAPERRRRRSRPTAATAA